MITSEPSSAPHDALDAVRDVLAPLAADVRRSLPGAVDGVDPEELHRLRVAIRRTRTILRELGELLPPERADPAGELFAHLADATGEPRDLDVYLEGWDGLVEGLAPELHDLLDPVRTALERRAAHAHHQLRLALGAASTTRGLDAWSEWLESGQPGRTDLHVLAPRVGARLLRLHERLVRDGRLITPASPGRELHDLRKRGKQLRYLVECFAPLYDRKPRRAFLAHLKDLQDNLGAHQDAEVQGQQLRSLAVEVNDGSASATDVVIAVGRLSDVLARRREAERAAFAEHFARYDRRRTTRLIDELLASAGVGPTV